MSIQVSGRLLFRWIVANSVGQLAGLALAAGVDILIFVLTGGNIHGLIFLTTALIMGFMEGAILGFFQLDALQDWFPQVDRRRWVRATGYGLALAWAVGLVGASAFVPAFAEAEHISVLALILISILAGTIFGGLVGVFQWFVLKDLSAKSAWWILANALAHPGAVLILYGSLYLSHHAETPGLIYSLGAVSGLATGVVTGAVTGVFLITLAKAPRVSREMKECPPKGA